MKKNMVWLLSLILLFFSLGGCVLCFNAPSYDIEEYIERASEQIKLLSPDFYVVLDKVYEGVKALNEISEYHIKAADFSEFKNADNTKTYLF